MSEARPGNELVRQIVDGDAPLNVRSAAARGVLPLPPATLVRLYVLLLEDPDGGVKLAATNSLQQLEPASILEVLGEASCASEVLSHFAKQAARDEALAERIAFHPQVGRDAIAVLATEGNPAVIELVLTNQERLLDDPSLLEKLMGNPTLRPGQQGRILELLDRAVKLKAKQVAAVDEQVESEELDDEPMNAEAAARLLDVDVGELLSASEILGAEELSQSDDPQVRSALRIIMTLNAAQKAILAMKGGREERMILVHDTNKVVALGVLKNPRLNEKEVEAIARMRNVTDDVLRYVAQSRDWTKIYAVIHALVANPRTPQTLSSNFIPRLSNRDLKNLAKSRDVPELIRRNAKRTHDLRTQKNSSSFKKR